HGCASPAIAGILKSIASRAQKIAELDDDGSGDGADVREKNSEEPNDDSAGFNASVTIETENGGKILIQQEEEGTAIAIFM
ncbi:hypothetical protein HDU76_011094, partial [Blyttiomyces sp. JEL0837]